MQPCFTSLHVHRSLLVVLSLIGRGVTKISNLNPSPQDQQMKWRKNGVTSSVLENLFINCLLSKMKSGLYKNLNIYTLRKNIRALPLREYKYKNSDLKIFACTYFFATITITNLFVNPRIKFFVSFLINPRSEV